MLAHISYQYLYSYDDFKLPLRVFCRARTVPGRYLHWGEQLCRVRVSPLRRFCPPRTPASAKHST